MSKKDVQVNFRMPEALKGTLEEVAKGNNRSLTAEIVSRLERSLEKSPVLVTTDVTKRLDELYQELHHELALIKFHRKAMGIVDAGNPEEALESTPTEADE